MNRPGWKITESLNCSTRHSDFSRRSDYNAHNLACPEIRRADGWA